MLLALHGEAGGNLTLRNNIDLVVTAVLEVNVVLEVNLVHQVSLLLGIILVLEFNIILAFIPFIIILDALLCSRCVC